MEEGLEKIERKDKNDREEIFSKAVRAGKRTYFFDVKATRRNDYYLTITESKKRFGKDGKFFFEKHKIFLYKEDFDKFAENLVEAIDFIKNSDHEMIEKEDFELKKTKETETEEYTNVEFEDLESNSEQ